MPAHRILTEDPQREQWLLLSPFMYPSNVRRYISERGAALAPDDPVADYVAGSLAQAQEYYVASQRASLNTSPLLLYYGLTNLLVGCLGLRLGTKPRIFRHGLRLVGATAVTCVGDLRMRACDPHAGAASQIEAELGKGAQLTQLGDWTLREVFASVPDIRETFLRCYDTAQPTTLPVEVVEVEALGPSGMTYLLERIERTAFDRFPSVHAALDRVVGFESAYLLAQSSGKYVILNRPLDANDIGIYSIMGNKHLLVSRLHGVQSTLIGELTVFLLGLFALADISRYRPHLWHPFVSADETGERLLVEHFLDVAHRLTPNLVLNVLQEKRLQFSPTGS